MRRTEIQKAFCWVLIIFILFVFISLPHIVNNDFWAPDADRIALDGIFMLDFLKDLPGSLMNVYGYTTEYYARYPALSIGYRPLFFPSIEAAFYFFFGLSHTSSKMAVLLFLFAGMFYWFLLVQKTHNQTIALLSLLLWITTPIVYRYSQYIMLEIPTLSMCIISIYYLYQYASNQSSKYAVLLGITTGLTLWTNQKSGFILPLLFLFPIFSGKFRLLFAKRTWIVYVIILVFLIPLILITIKLGAQNLEQSIGNLSKSNRFSVPKMFKHIYFLYQFHLSAPILILALVGMFFAAFYKKSENLLYAVAIFCVYLFFTFIKHKIYRYSMYWIPFFCCFAAIGLKQLIDYLSGRMKNGTSLVRYAIYGAVVVFQLFLLPNTFVSYASGYEDAAKFALNHTKSPVLFFDGWANGQFIFFVRIHDPDRHFVVLRGSKILASSSVTYKHKLKLHLHDKEEIHQTLNKFGVQFIVVESRSISGVKIYNELRTLLHDKTRYKLHKTIKIKSNQAHLKNQNLLIYENLTYKGIEKDSVLELRLPIVGQEIKMKLKQILPDATNAFRTKM